MNFTIIIPARYGSTRLPGKPLLEVKGKPLLQHAYESACKSKAGNIVIATDDKRIKDAAEGFGAVVILTSDQHVSGTDRIAEAARSCDLEDDEIIINVQGDEFGLPAELIDQVAAGLKKNQDKQMATLCEVLTDENEINDSNIVKVLFDINNTALYFSRSPIPWVKTGNNHRQCYRHIGLYAYTAHSLQAFTELESCLLEQEESLEQLRALYNGWKIHVEVATTNAGTGVDTEEDLKRVNLHSA